MLKPIRGSQSANGVQHEAELLSTQSGSGGVPDRICPSQATVLCRIPVPCRLELEDKTSGHVPRWHRSAVEAEPLPVLSSASYLVEQWGEGVLAYHGLSVPEFRGATANGMSTLVRHGWR